jgi:Leucine-rich repeat (LRR) protein
MFLFVNQHTENGSFYSLKKALQDPKKVKELILTDSSNLDIIDSLVLLTNLESIIFRNIKVDTLYEVVCNIPSLKSISVFSSGIKVLPEKLGNLGGLEKLILFSTPISELPESIIGSKNLKFILIFDTKMNDGDINKYYPLFYKSTLISTDRFSGYGTRID